MFDKNEEEGGRQQLWVNIYISAGQVASFHPSHGGLVLWIEKWVVVVEEIGQYREGERKIRQKKKRKKIHTCSK